MKVHKSDINLSINDQKAKILVTIQPPDTKNRSLPCDVCCVVDISGSMGSQATLKSDKGDDEENGLCILDVVRHAITTIVEVLQPEDRIAVVVFNDNANEVKPLTKMSKKGKGEIKKAMEELQADHNTNLWAGLELGLDVLNKGKTAGRQSVLLLLTDGSPNVNPPHGNHITALKEYKKKNPLDCSIYTFGFGYTLDSNLLDEIAVEGNGSYSFIPDCSLVGTVFINMISNILVTFAKHLEVTIGKKIKGNSIVGGFPVQSKKHKTVINLGALQYGQKRDMVICLDKDTVLDCGDITVSYTRIDNGKSEAINTKSFSTDNSDEIEIQYLRLLFNDYIRNCIAQNDLQKSNTVIDTYVANIGNNANIQSQTFIQDLLKDLTGQIKEAFSKKEWYDKWGKHYLPSIARAHLLQQCNNFKDPGVQHYGGPLFSKLRDEADEIFRKLPPPKPTETFFKWTNNGPVPIVVPQTMDNFHNAYGGCISGDSTVSMANGTEKLVKNIVKGDIVKSADNQYATVICVIKTTFPENEKVSLVGFPGGLVITPWHPVRYNGRWEFPCMIGKLYDNSCKEVYNFVLDKNHSMSVNGMDCVTLGHGLTDDVVKHEYWGTEKVINNLKQLVGWSTGFIDLNLSSTIQRDEVTGLVSSIQIKQKTVKV